jgi:hypothetical protein
MRQDKYDIHLSGISRPGGEPDFNFQIPFISFLLLVTYYKNRTVFSARYYIIPEKCYIINTFSELRFHFTKLQNI